jgi:DNA-binding winged helix-turn-helix (wHTH) protein
MTAFAGPATVLSETQSLQSAFSPALLLDEAADQIPGSKFLDELRTQGYFPILIFVPHPAAGASQLSSNLRLGRVSTNPQFAAEPSPSVSSGGVFTFGDVTVNFRSMESWRKGKQIPLRAKEFKTLAYMIRNPGRVISRDELLDEVWGYKSYPCTRTVDNHILRLRTKLESDPAHPKHLLTVHGTGYKFVP